jgi:3-methyladenine DNA glycosylase AlkD
MKFFPVDPEIDQRIEFLMRQIRHLKDGETAELIEKSGAHYRINYGVSLVHLRKMVEGVSLSTELARRLWHRQIRETMIIATMLLEFDQMTDQELNEWGHMLNTIELAEQLGRNFFVVPDVPSTVVIFWLKSEHFYMKYAAAMGIGWRLRMHNHEGFSELPDVLPTLKSMASDPRFCRAVGFALKMAGRFSSFQQLVLEEVKEWQKSDDVYVCRVAEEVIYEVEAFL